MDVAAGMRNPHNPQTSLASFFSSQRFTCTYCFENIIKSLNVEQLGKHSMMDIPLDKGSRSKIIMILGNLLTETFMRIFSRSTIAYTRTEIINKASNITQIVCSWAACVTNKNLWTFILMPERISKLLYLGFLDIFFFLPTNILLLAAMIMQV